MRRALVAVAVATVAAAVPAPASAAPGADEYSCDIESLQVQNELDDGGSGPFTATGSAQCWTAADSTKVSTQLSASGTYTAQNCSLITVAQPSYLTLSGTLTMTPSGGSPVSIGMTITTADVATATTGPGTISLHSGRQAGPVIAKYHYYLLGFVARCGGDGFSPVYSGTFLRT